MHQQATDGHLCVSVGCIDPCSSWVGWGGHKATSTQDYANIPTNKTPEHLTPLQMVFNGLFTMCCSA